MTTRAVGIDLGTTFSAIAHVNKYGVPEILHNAEGERITPSVVLFEGEEVIISRGNTPIAKLSRIRRENDIDALIAEIRFTRMCSGGTLITARTPARAYP